MGSLATSEFHASTKKGPAMCGRGFLQGLHSRDRGVSHYGWYGILSCGVGLRGRGENGACGTRRGSPRSLRCLPVHDLYTTTRTTGTIRTEKSQERQRHTQVGTWYG